MNIYLCFFACAWMLSLLLLGRVFVAVVVVVVLVVVVVVMVVLLLLFLISQGTCDGLCLGIFQNFAFFHLYWEWEIFFFWGGGGMGGM